jgi:hypothetical protein
MILGWFVLGFTVGNELDLADQDVFCMEVNSVTGRSDGFMGCCDVGAIIAAEVFHDSAPTSECVAGLGWNVISGFSEEMLSSDLGIQL